MKFTEFTYLKKTNYTVATVCICIIYIVNVWAHVYIHSYIYLKFCMQNIFDILDFAFLDGVFDYVD